MSTPAWELRAEAALVVFPAVAAFSLALMLIAEGLHWPAAAHALTALMLLSSLATWFLRRHSLLLACWLLATSVLLLLLGLQLAIAAPAILYLLALPVILAAILIGPWAAIALAAGATLGILYAARGLASAPDGALAIVLIWSMCAIVSAFCQLVAHSTDTLSAQHLRMYEQLEAARADCLVLQQTQEDLLQANTELARLSDRLKWISRIAEEARQAKAQFVANVSHELRTPLNMVIGFSEMIVGSTGSYGTNLPPALKADLSVILRNAQHLSTLIDDVLDLAQVEAGRMALIKERVSLAEVIATAANAVARLFASKGLYLEIDVAPDLPPIYCDRTRVRQVALNLLSNAARFTVRGGVRLRAWQEGGDLVVSVADTGPGIAAADAGRLFEPFQQLDGSIRRKYGGTGLGLAISREFVELHGGTMWLESEKGEGATFFFRLPIEPLVPTTADAASRLAPEWEFRQRTRPTRAPAPDVVPRLVVVEEGSALRQVLTRYMDKVEVVPVLDLAAAIQEAQRVPAHAVLINDTSVAAVLQRMELSADLPPATPAIICSLPSALGAAVDLGANGYLVKPVLRDDLLSMLEGLDLRGNTVLIVDDEPEAARLFWRILASSERNYRVLTARDGAQALSILRQQRPDVMLLDLVMPEMDGFRVLRERNLDPQLREIPVVVLSARDPAGQPVMSDALAIMQANGLTVQQIMALIQAAQQILGEP
jgi:signal transduction histidine kinase/CheY-like chemotaxis protein